MLAAPMRLNGDSNYPYPVSEPLEGEKEPSGLLDNISAVFGGDDEPEEKPFKARIKQNIRPIEHGVAKTFQSPFFEKRSITLFTAASDTNHHSYMEALQHTSLCTTHSHSFALPIPHW